MGSFVADLRGVIAVGSFQELLAFMQLRGSSVLLNWGEDNDAWECSWISSGKRTTAFASDPELATRRCAMQVLKDLMP